MTVLEILQKRKEIYEKDLRKTYLTEDIKHDTESRLRELDSLIFIITTQEIKKAQ